MQFLAVRSDRPLPPEFQDRFVPSFEVECYKCNQVRYFLYVPTLETENDQVTALAIWLDEQLPKVCPDHPDWFLTPDASKGH
jgi:hypothetical protein